MIIYNRTPYAQKRRSMDIIVSDPATTSDVLEPKDVSEYVSSHSIDHAKVTICTTDSINSLKLLVLLNSPIAIIYENCGA